jgi:hypothetical protein
VSFGWDKDLDRFIMNINSGFGVSSEPIYTNIYSPAQSHEKYDMEGFKAILRKIGIEVPDAIFARANQCGRLLK